MKYLILWLRLGMKLRPVFREMERMKGMKFSVNFVIQALALVAQAAMQTSEILPPKGKFWASVIVAATQGIAGVLAHFVNPDGTPAKQPYVKGKQ
jgi:hypothetical protein